MWVYIAHALWFSIHRLNEGITTYLERKIVGKLHGEQERHLHAMGTVKEAHSNWKEQCHCLLLSCRWLESLERCSKYLMYNVMHVTYCQLCVCVWQLLLCTLIWILAFLTCLYNPSDWPLPVWQQVCADCTGATSDWSSPWWCLLMHTLWEGVLPPFLPWDTAGGTRSVQLQPEWKLGGGAIGIIHNSVHVPLLQGC